MSINPDCRHKSRGVWLIKVPKYMSQRWRNLAGAAEVGRMRISMLNNPKNPNEKAEVRFLSTTVLPDSQSMDSGYGSQSLPGSQASHDSSPYTVVPATDVPQVHKFRISALNNQSLIVLKEDKRSVFDEIDEKPVSLSIEGQVVQRAECQPPTLTNDYRTFKRDLVAKSAKPINQLRSINKAEIKFKPVSRHAELMVSERAKKDNKNVRMEKTALMDLLFQAFEKHQYYKLFDLSRVTAQPPNYLKEVLQEIATYNTMPPHKYTWELKPEYRHYKDPEPM